MWEERRERVQGRVRRWGGEVSYKSGILLCRVIRNRPLSNGVIWFWKPYFCQIPKKPCQMIETRLGVIPAFGAFVEKLKQLRYSQFGG